MNAVKGQGRPQLHLVAPSQGREGPSPEDTDAARIIAAVHHATPEQLQTLRRVAEALVYPAVASA